MVFIPRRNETLEADQHQKWLEKGLLAITKRVAAVEASLAKLLAANATSGKQVAVINARETGSSVSGGGGLPEGGYRGSVLARDNDGTARWTSPIGSIVPKYYITLEDGASTYQVNTYGSFGTQDAAKLMLPAPLFEYSPDVAMDWPISWANEFSTAGGFESDPMPIQLEVTVVPHSDGETFDIEVPSSWMGSGGAPWFTLVVFNSTAYTASLRIGSDAVVYEGGWYRSDVYEDLAPGEYLAWKVDNVEFEGVAKVQPFWASKNLGGGIRAAVPLDNQYWKQVRALEYEHSYTFGGSLSTTTGGFRFYNNRPASVRIGKVVASVGTAPTGASIQIEAKINGTTDIFATPLTIPAGEFFADAVPDAGDTDISGVWVLPAGDVAVLLMPDDYLSVEVTQVGSSVPGSDLNVQVYYG